MARCTCGWAHCPVCFPENRVFGATHEPWREVIPDPELPFRAHMAEDPEAVMQSHRRWETWQSIRRYLLVLLLIFVGSMAGSAITILAFIHYN